MHRSVPANINNLPTKAKLTQLEIAGLVDVIYCYLDTVEVFFRDPPRMKRLFRLHYPRVPLCFTRRARHGRVHGWSMFLHQGATETILELARMAKVRRGSTSRADFAYDLISQKHKEQLREWLNQHLTMKHRRRGNMKTYDNGNLYLIKQKGRRRSNRDIAIYDTRASKVTGETECVHVELRAQSPRTLRAMGVVQVKDLLHLDPKTVWDKFIQFVTHDLEQFVIKATRKQKEMEFYAGLSHKRIRNILERMTQGYAQYIKDECKGIKTIVHDSDVLTFPQHWEGGIEAVGQFPMSGDGCVVDIGTRIAMNERVRVRKYTKEQDLIHLWLLHGENHERQPIFRR